MIKRDGLVEIARLKQLDLDGLQEAQTFLTDFTNCLRCPSEDLEQALEVFFAKYNTIIG